MTEPSPQGRKCVDVAAYGRSAPKMLMFGTPLAALGLLIVWIAFTLGAGMPLVVVGILLCAPMLVVLDQGWVILQLSPRGFTIRSAGRTSSVAWDQVERFYLRRVPAFFESDKVFIMTNTIEVKLRESAGPSARKLRWLTGYLSSVGMDPEVELELLESWRRRWSHPER